MKTYINKKDKRVVFVVPLEATTQDGYIVMNDGVIGWESKESFDKLYEEEPNYSETVIDRGLSKILNSLFTANENINDKDNMTCQTPTDEEIKQSEKELNEDLIKKDEYLKRGFYWLEGSKSIVNKTLLKTDYEKV